MGKITPLSFLNDKKISEYKPPKSESKNGYGFSAPFISQQQHTARDEMIHFMRDLHDAIKGTKTFNGHSLKIGDLDIRISGTAMSDKGIDLGTTLTVFQLASDYLHANAYKTDH